MGRKRERERERERGNERRERKDKKKKVAGVEGDCDMSSAPQRERGGGTEREDRGLRMCVSHPCASRTVASQSMFPSVVIVRSAPLERSSVCELSLTTGHCRHQSSHPVASGEDVRRKRSEILVGFENSSCAFCLAPSPSLSKSPPMCSHVHNDDIFLLRFLLDTLLPLVVPAFPHCLHAPVLSLSLSCSHTNTKQSTSLFVKVVLTFWRGVNK